jgi:hypothetical protein
LSLCFYFQMLNLREPYSPFSTTTFEAFALRGTLKANYIFYYPTKITLRDKGMPRYPTPHTCPHNTQRSQRPNIPQIPTLHLSLWYWRYQSSFYKPKEKITMSTITKTFKLPSGGTFYYLLESYKKN